MVNLEYYVEVLNPVDREKELDNLQFLLKEMGAEIKRTYQTAPIFYVSMNQETAHGLSELGYLVTKAQKDTLHI